MNDRRGQTEGRQVAYRKNEHASLTQRGGGGAGPNVARAVAIITCVAAVVAVVKGGGQPIASAEGQGTSVTAPAVSPDPESAEAPSSTSDASGALATVAEGSEPTTPTPSVPRVGIVAGHWGSDDGAACPDGLTEVKVNLEVAELVVQSLRGLGYEVDLLQEYDERREGYLADALVSIHADSCMRFPDATPAPTGFKVASVVDSAVPEEEQKLVACLTEEYGRRTGLPVHENSITGHMTGYHTFYDIDGRTPGAIIETGFLWLDRELLTRYPDLVAQGIVDGVVCYVEGE